MSNVFAIQDDIAGAVARELNATLNNRNISDQHGINEEAYIASLEGSYHYERYTEEGLEKAIQYFEKALTIDPNYPRAWIGLAWAHIAQADSGYRPLEEGYALALSEAKKGLELDPNDAEAYSAIGWIQGGYYWDWKAADATYQRALELEPGQAGVNANAATLCGTLGRFEKALELDRRAIKLDPLNAAVHSNHGNHAFRAGKFEEARASLFKTLELSPEYPGGRTFLARIYLQQSKFDDALAEVQKETTSIWRTYGLALTYFALNRRADADVALQEMIRIGAQDAAFQIAEIYGYRGEVDQAFQWLERAYVQRDGGLVEIKGDPLFRNLHNDPRWPAFLKKMKLPID
jgi:tetratricopeptide (TPR) repeat protein